MRNIEKVKSELKRMREAMPPSYPGAIVIDQVAGETIEGEMRKRGIPESARGNIVWIIDNIG